MNLLDYLCFLVGTNKAVHGFAASYWTLAIGGLLVLTAGIARNYTRYNLRRDAWRLAVPFGAAVASSFGLWAWLHAFAWWNHVPFGNFLEGYASFLGLYLLTAPLAWIYGIKVERWTYRTRAVRIRLAMLGLVAAWRVALILRVLYVLLDASGVGLLFVVMMYVSMVAVIAIAVTTYRREDEDPAPLVIEFMGAMPAPERHERKIINKAGCSVSVASLLCFVFSWMVLSVSPNNAFDSWQLTELARANTSPAIDIWIFSVVAVVGWLSLLPLAQGQLALADRVQSICDAGQLSESLTIAIKAGPKAFPASWEPPPNRFGSEHGKVPFLTAVEEVFGRDDASWLVPYYRRQMFDFCDDARWFWSTSELEQLVAVLGQLQHPQDLAVAAWDAWEELSGYQEMVSSFHADISDETEIDADRSELENILDPKPPMTIERIAALDNLRKLAGVEKTDDAKED